MSMVVTTPTGCTVMVLPRITMTRWIPEQSPLTMEGTTPTRFTVMMPPHIMALTTRFTIMMPPRIMALTGSMAMHPLVAVQVRLLLGL